MAAMEQFEKFRADVWRTAGARFNAARRLRRREAFSSVSLALFSAAIIVVSLVQVLYAKFIDNNMANALTVLVVSFGIFALVISLVEAGARSGERASRLFINAENLNDFQKRLGVADPAMLESHLKEYKSLKDSLGDNHEPIDDDYFISSHPDAPEFSKVKKKNPLRVASFYFSSSIWHLIAIWIAFSFCLVMVLVLSWGQKSEMDGHFESSTHVQVSG